MTYLFEIDMHAKTNTRGKHRVLHIMQRASIDRRRDQMRPHQRYVLTLVVNGNHMTTHALLENNRTSASLDVIAN